VQLRQIEDRKIDTAVPLIGDGVFPNDYDTVSQARDGQPQAPITEKEKLLEMRRLLPVSNFSTPPTPKNFGSSYVSMFRSSIEGAGTERSLENISESPSSGNRVTRLSKSSMIDESKQYMTKAHSAKILKMIQMIVMTIALTKLRKVK
jgi:hypothetical protein